jgi:O-antigen ligase
VRFPFKWWQMVWLLLLLSGLVFRARSAAEINDSPVDGWALYRIGCVFIAGAILFARLSMRKTQWLPNLFSGSIGIFVLYPLICLVSTGWSVRPPWTLYRSVEFLIDLCALAAVVTIAQSAEEYKKLVNWTWTLLGLLVLSSWVGAVFDPSDALFSDPNLRIIPLRMRLVGVVPVVSCNDLSEVCATLALVALCRLWADPDAQEKKNRYRLLFVASIVTLVVTQTRGSFAAFFLGFILLLILTHRYLLAAVGGIVSLVAGSALLLFTNFGAGARSFLLRGESADQASGLSGRLEMWQASYYKIIEQPLTGYGGFAGARFVVINKNSISSSNLNSFVDSALDVGIFGPLILLAVLLVAGWVLLKSIRGSGLLKPESYLALEMFMALTVLVVRSVESSNLITHPMLSFLTIVGAAQVMRHERKTVLAMNTRQSLSWQP